MLNTRQLLRAVSLRREEEGILTIRGESDPRTVCVCCRRLSALRYSRPGGRRASLKAADTGFVFFSSRAGCTSVRVVFNI